MLGADENIEAARAAAPPPFWCPSHGWVVCPLHEYGPAVRRSSASIFEFGGTSSAAAIDAGAIAPRLPSPTPAVVEMEGDALTYLSVQTRAPTFTVDSGVRSFTSAAVAAVLVMVSWIGEFCLILTTPVLTRLPKCDFVIYGRWSHS
jgi:hypothetical protein